ncbi:hypothetical protein ACFV1N_41720, partial [Streptosporangium canum]
SRPRPPFGSGASADDWNDPFGRLSLQPLAMAAGSGADLGHMRAREGMTLAKENGRLNGERPELPGPPDCLEG